MVGWVGVVGWGLGGLWVVGRLGVVGSGYWVVGRVGGLRIGALLTEQ